MSSETALASPAVSAPAAHTLTFGIACNVEPVNLAAALDDHNARVRRLARDYAPKYRPLVFSLGYHANLAEGLGRTFIKIETIVAESARYTASGKPLQVRYVKRLLSEMQRVGALKAEARYREDTGRQTSSYRALVTSVSVDRHGNARAHDFYAPFSESAQVTGKKDTPQDTAQDTPQDTAQDTPQDTAQDTRTSFELDLDWKGTDKYLSPEGLGTSSASPDSQGQEPAPAGPAPSGDDFFTWYVWRAKSGSLAIFNKADRELDMRMIPRRAVQFSLSPEDGKWLWDTWAEYGL
ncbi:MAG: hypothetical protein ACRDRJ_03060 [Streptosporangiaceae bacterium]